MATCEFFRILEITDGTFEGTINLLDSNSGFILEEWSPAITEPKGGGVKRDSQISDGSQLVLRKVANVSEQFTLGVRNFSADALILDLRKLRTLLERAVAYRTTSWQNTPVYIKRQGVNESNPTYALIEDYRTPQDQNPLSGDFLLDMRGKSSFPSFNLTLEREPYWRALPPGETECVESSSEDYSYRWELATAAPVAAVQCLIALSSGWLLAGETGAVWRSLNGVVWAAAAAPPAGVIYAFAEDAKGYVYSLGAGGVYRSTDNGNNWVLRNAGFTSTEPNSLFYSPTNSYLYGVGFVGGVGRLRRSNDDGATWNVVTTHILTADPVFRSSQDVLFLGSIGVGGTIIDRSEDFGAVWNRTYRDAGVVGTFESFIETPAGHIVAGRSTGGLEGVYITTDGWTWTQVVAYPRSVFDICYRQDGRLLAVLAAGRIAYGSKDGLSWSSEINLNFAGNIYCCELFEGDVYVGTSAGDIWIQRATPIGRSETCLDEAFLSNKRALANITHVFVYDAAPVSWTAQFPAAAFPFALFPAAPAIGDILYLGCETLDTFLSGPFDNAIFDIVTQVPFTTTWLTWEYSDGVAGWPVLTVQDATDEFMRSGVNSLHWVPPAAWAPEAVNGVTAYWIRAIVTSAMASSPRQGNRDIYSCSWERLDISANHVVGDVPALAGEWIHARADKDGPAGNEPGAWANRYLLSLRTVSRGEFGQFINLSDEQTMPGMSVVGTARTVFANDIEAPTGRRMTHTTDGTSTWRDEATVSIDPSAARDLYGAYHIYLRAQQTTRSAAMDEVRVRIQVRTGVGGVSFTTGYKPFSNLNDWQLMDFQGISIPVSSTLSPDDLGDQAQIVVQVWSSVAALVVHLYDLCLVPIDEWAIDAVDRTLEDDSCVENGYALNVDSVVTPKCLIRSLVRNFGSSQVRAIYQPNCIGPAVLQANTNQRLYLLVAAGKVTGAHTGANNQTTLTDANASFLTSGVKAGQVIFNLTDGSRGMVGATVTATTISNCSLTGGVDNDWDTNDQYLIICPCWVSEPWMVHSLQVEDCERYISMRGVD